MRFIVYLVRNVVNELYYIGYTRAEFSLRWKQHCYDARKGKRTRLHCAIRRYGSDGFSYEILSKVATEEEAQHLETLWIISLRSWDPKVGYNMCFGGNRGPNLKGREFPGQERGSKLTNYRIRKGQTRVEFCGPEKAAEWTRRGAEAIRGKIRSEEFKEKDRQAHLGKPAWNKGIPCRQSTKNKLSDLVSSTICITNGIISKRILKTDSLPSGWRYGCARKRKSIPPECAPIFEFYSRYARP